MRFSLRELNKAKADARREARSHAFREVLDMLNKWCPHASMRAKAECDICRREILDILEQGHLLEEKP